MGKLENQNLTKPIPLPYGAELKMYMETTKKHKSHFYPLGTRVKMTIRNYDLHTDEIYFGEVIGINEDGYFPKSHKWNQRSQHQKKYKIKLDDGSIEYCYKFQVEKEHKY